MLDFSFSPSARTPSLNALRWCWFPSSPAVLRPCEPLPHDCPAPEFRCWSLLGPIFSKPDDFAVSVRNPNTEGIRPFESGAGSSELSFVSLGESCSNVCFLAQSGHSLSGLWGKRSRSIDG